MNNMLLRKIYAFLAVCLLFAGQGKVFAQTGTNTGLPAIYFDGMRLEIVSQKIITGNTLSYTLSYPVSVSTRFEVFKTRITVETANGQSWSTNSSGNTPLNQSQVHSIPLDLTGTNAYISINIILNDYGPDGQQPVVNHTIEKRVVSNNIALQPGSVSGSAVSACLSGGYAGALQMSEPAGGVAKRYKYRWQQYGNDWVDVPGETAAGLSPQLMDDCPRKYRRLVVSDTSFIVDTNLIAVGPEFTVFPLSNPKIAAAQKVVSYNVGTSLSGNEVAMKNCNNGTYNPAAITITYQWQQQVGGVFSDIPGAIAKGLTSTGNLTSPTQFRRKFSAAGVTGYSNEVFIDILPPTLTGVAELPRGSRTYVQSVTITKPGVNNMGEVHGLNALQHLQTSEYFDGLGRGHQSIVRKGSLETNISTPTDTTGAKDLVNPVVYDALGREELKYQPYAAPSSDGQLKSDPIAEQRTFYNNYLSQQPGEVTAGNNWAYSRSIFEASPLNRIIERFAPGVNWVGTAGAASEADRHSTRHKTDVNTAADNIRVWNVTNAETIGVLGTYSSSGVYPPGALQKSIAADEHLRQSIEFKDKQGRLVLKKVQLTAVSDNGGGADHTGWLCTYYIYDDLGNLRCVVSPQATEALVNNGWNLAVELLNQLCFQYAYDGRGRMNIKKVPGAGMVEMTYDLRDRLVFSRDGNLRSAGKWVTTFYDDFDRPVMTALYTTTETVAQLQTGLNNAVTSQTITSVLPVQDNLTVNQHDGRAQYKAAKEIELTSGFDTGGSETEISIDPSATQATMVVVAVNCLPSLNQTQLEPLAYTFYDDYNYQGKKNAEAVSVSHTGNPEIDEQPVATATQGLVTGIRIKLLDGSNQWLTTTTYYDGRGRVRQVLADNAINGVDVQTNLYDFGNRLIGTRLQHRNPKSALTPQTDVQTMSEYDHLGRLVRIRKQINNETPVDIATIRYDALGRLKEKLYKRSDQSVLETLEQDYNVRGWLSGINKAYANGGTGHFFGQELHYDRGFAGAGGQFNGDIAAVNWRGTNNAGTQHAYMYGYDNASRLLKGDYRQSAAGANSWAVNSAELFDMKVGDGVNPATAYDGNGNIKAMTQYSITGLGASSVIDQLQYKYKNNGYSNQLDGVQDGANNAVSVLGDFKEPAPGLVDEYGYDNNGNLTRDGNKGITQITYNHLNLPAEITIPGRGIIRYVYDATGVKHRKIVRDETVSPVKETITDYVGGMVYEYDSLRLIGHEEGRIRAVYPPGQPVAYKYDYFVKDHLGNVRMVLTEENGQQLYLASMEQEASATENALFSNIESSRSAKPVGYPQDASAGSENKQVAKLNGSNPDKRVGPSLVLKVMAGDTVSIGAKAFYKSIDTKQDKQQLPAADMAAALLRAFSAGEPGGGHKEASSAGVIRTPFNDQFINDGYRRMKEKEPQDGPQAGRPRAYLNFAMFDEQFNLVEGNSGVRQVKAEPDQLQTLAQDKMVIEKSGFLYVYTSNETPQDVFFDNVVVMNNPGPVLEETHYYPFGLVMTGISAKAIYSPVNKHELFQGQPLDDELGLNWYGFKWRNHDPQIGRFIEIDPLASDYTHNSPYAFSENHVTAHVELEGLEKWSIKNGIGETVNLYGPYANQNAAQQHFNDNMTTSGRTLTLTRGFVENNRIMSKRVKALERGTLSDVNGVVLHRTASSSTEGTLRTFENGRDGVNYGTHFLVGREGEILQTASLDSYTLHVGKTRNKAYPTNSNSVGIEVVGNYDYKTQSWEPLTDAQITSTSFLTNSLKMTYNLTNAQVYNHEDISYKTSGEGRVVRSAISRYLVPPPPQNTSNNKTPWWMQYITK